GGWGQVGGGGVGGVGEGERDLQPALVRRRLQVVVGECRVGQAIPEREQGRDAILVVPAVAEVDALGVVLFVVHAGVGVRVACDRRLVLAGRERLCQLA